MQSYIHGYRYRLVWFSPPNLTNGVCSSGSSRGSGQTVIADCYSSTPVATPCIQVAEAFWPAGITPFSHPFLSGIVNLGLNETRHNLSILTNPSENVRTSFAFSGCRSSHIVPVE
ncbi:uncharacterized protein ARMOST_11372 [Armillaria ostoyae]|uniref:Uncharacterized protein n=1 Tax=Armillaria ostoyae TaxID=47428 RepID=A0A284RGX8_ARMOS|nr:uncharacterized protein ARMOST_11372 [Armillaria ostoyae]